MYSYVLGLPQFTPVFKLMMLKKSFIYFPYVLKLEKTVRFESTDSSSKIRVHSPLSCQSKYFQLLIIPRREKSHKIPHNAKEPIPSKLINIQGVEIEFPSPKQLQKQKIFKTTHLRKQCNRVMSLYTSRFQIALGE